MSLSKIIPKFSSNSNTVYVSYVESPIGQVSVAADDKYLYLVAFTDSKRYEKTFEALGVTLSCKFVVEKNKILHLFEEELTAYFNGKLKKFTTPVKTFGTEFQQLVWDTLIKIPFGTTETYADFATTMGKSSKHSRAVGAACKANPMPIVIPCHRVVAANSKGGFNCGVDRKETLLDLEQKYK